MPFDYLCLYINAKGKRQGAKRLLWMQTKVRMNAKRQDECKETGWTGFSTK